MSRSIFLVGFLFHATACLSQQKILLIGTLHQTPKDRLDEIAPVASAVENFHPEVICAEYPMPTDTATVKYKGGEDIFIKRKALQKEWNVGFNMNAKIEVLQKDLSFSSDIKKRMELQQLYFLSSDMGNADFQGYLIMTKTENDSQKSTWLSMNFPGYKTMKGNYEIKRKRNDEYFRLVFPLATKLNIGYIYPIDDLSSWKEYEKYYDRLQVPDTTDIDKIKFRKYGIDFFENLKSLPKDSSQWFFSNSRQVIQYLLQMEGYIIDGDILNQDVKMLQYYWVQRNKIMAMHIDQIAQAHPYAQIVVFFGASHVGSVREELNKLNKNYHVLTLLDLMDPK